MKKQKSEPEVLVKQMLSRAKSEPKGSYPVYAQYKRELEIINLSPEDYTQAVIKLSRVLKV